MGACATKPGDLKVKGEPPLVVEDAAAAPVVVAGEEKEKPKVDVVVPAAAAETEVAADGAGRRRSLSDLLKQDAETSDGEAAQAAEKVVVVEPAASDAGVGDAGATTGAQEPVQTSVATEQDGTAAGELKDEPHGDDDAQAVVEEEKRVDPGSVQVAVPAAEAEAEAAATSAEECKVAEAAVPSAEESKVAEAEAAAPNAEESKVAEAEAAAPSAEESKVADDASA